MKNGKKNRKGTYHYKNGDSFEGHFKDELKCGKGQFRKTNGVLIEGNWVEDQLNGEYVYYKGNLKNKKV